MSVLDAVRHTARRYHWETLRREIGAWWARTRRSIGTMVRAVRLPRWLLAILGAFLLLAVGVLAEMRTSWVQARVFSRLAAGISYEVGAGESLRIRYPDSAPYPDRLGYSRLAEHFRTLEGGTFQIDSQAVVSSSFAKMVDLGLFPIYREKSHAGLTIRDRDGHTMFRAVYPARTYASFDSIPPVVLRTLLFIENRALLDESRRHRNPAVEWDRFALAAFRQIPGPFGDHDGPGGSTLATQLEKFRYSPHGLTHSAREKVRQMASASLRAYMDGPSTLDARHRLVAEYVNTMPLSGMPGYGEVIGLAEGLEVWFGADFDSVNALLRPVDDGLDADAGVAYRQVLSLLLANRRPSYFLTTGREALRASVDEHLPYLAEQEVISHGLARLAAEATVHVLETPRARQPLSFVGRKAPTAVRTDLLSILGVETFYELDHYDLDVATTFDLDVQNSVSAMLESLKDPAFVREQGMEGFRLLSRGDPTNVYYAVTLFEAAPEANHLILQSDNFEGPFNVNEGAKLELGSTAKLRTLVAYLEIVEALHAQYAGRPVGELVQGDAPDPITSWAVRYLRNSPSATVPQMLDAALDRTYSSSPYERFFTGGGIHVFHNFSASDSSGVYTVRSGFRHSVNLVFIRLMRDIVRYHTARLPGDPEAMLENGDDPRRRTYLARFADREGRQFLYQFHERYSNSEDVWAVFVAEHRPTARELAWALRAVYEQMSVSELSARFERLGFASEAAEDLYGVTDARPFNWHDRGYLADVHPLELWYLNYRGEHPAATWNEIADAGTTVRQEAYQWLFKANAKAAQDRRIRTLIEEEAFARIHRAWVGTGYPFDRLVPSLATAIGSSADRPRALAELVGIILRDGYRYRATSIRALHFADGTPFETALSPAAEPPERVLSHDVAEALKNALVDVVEHGTAVRIRGGVTADDGTLLMVGGKTGTGDNRIKIYNEAGRVRADAVVNRTSTFVFFIGERWFGTVTAFVTGPDAANYRFTSSLPVQLLKSLSDELRPVLHPPAAGSAGIANARTSRGG